MFVSSYLCSHATLLKIREKIPAKPESMLKGELSSRTDIVLVDRASKMLIKAFWIFEKALFVL